jgi:hypothetical protein
LADHQQETGPMKSRKLSPEQREDRRDAIMAKREATHAIHRQRGRSYVQYRTTRFDKRQSDRATARYAKQTGYVAPAAAPVAVKRTTRARKTG